MRVTRYILEHSAFILGYALYSVIIAMYLQALGVRLIDCICIFTFTTACLALTALFRFYYKKRKLEKIENNLQALEEKYLLAEIIEKPYLQEEKAYYQILKKTNKSMIEKVESIYKKQKEYKEYIESWIHEIKMPITSIQLICENHKNEETRKIAEEVDSIHNYVEQALFYARLEHVADDYILQVVNLEEVIQQVIARNKARMIQKHMQIELQGLEKIVKTDEKWLYFICNQIVLNAIQYTKMGGKICISAEEIPEGVKLSIIDNGEGIAQSEIERIFEKGFTGSNGRKVYKKSTGLGLYLCKRLCEKMKIGIYAESKQGEYMAISLQFTRDDKMEILQ